MDQLKAGVSKALPVLVGGSAFIAPSISNALTKDDLSSLSYLQVHPLAFLPPPPPFPVPSLLSYRQAFLRSHKQFTSFRLLSPLTLPLTTGEGHGPGEPMPRSGGRGQHWPAAR